MFAVHGRLHCRCLIPSVLLRATHAYSSWVRPPTTLTPTPAVCTCDERCMAVCTCTVCCVAVCTCTVCCVAVCTCTLLHICRMRAKCLLIWVGVRVRVTGSLLIWPLEFSNVLMLTPLFSSHSVCPPGDLQHCCWVPPCRVSI
eukprot:225923-Chlamydomonas_euryale.AAC.4